MLARDIDMATSTVFIGGTGDPDSAARPRRSAARDATSPAEAR
jgi:hypothetical protein